MPDDNLEPVVVPQVVGGPADQVGVFGADLDPGYLTSNAFYTAVQVDGTDWLDSAMHYTVGERVSAEGRVSAVAPDPVLFNDGVSPRRIWAFPRSEDVVNPAVGWPTRILELHLPDRGARRVVTRRGGHYEIQPTDAVTATSWEVLWDVDVPTSLFGPSGARVAGVLDQLSRFGSEPLDDASAIGLLYQHVGRLQELAPLLGNRINPADDASTQRWRGLDVVAECIVSAAEALHRETSPEARRNRNALGLAGRIVAATQRRLPSNDAFRFAMVDLPHAALWVQAGDALDTLHDPHAPLVTLWKAGRIASFGGDGVRLETYSAAADAWQSMSVEGLFARAKVAGPPGQAPRSIPRGAARVLGA